MPAVEALYAELAQRGDPIAPQTRALTRLLDTHGADRLQAAITEAVERGTPRAVSVEHILTRNARRNGEPERRPLILPKDRPELTELTIENHDLGDYDDLA